MGYDFHVCASKPPMNILQTNQPLTFFQGGLQRQGGASLVRATHGAPSSGAPERSGKWVDH